MENLAQLIPGTKNANIDYDKYLEEKVKAYNSTTGKLTGYNCKECLNRGCIAEIKNGIEVMSECKCMKKRRALKRLQQSGLAANIRSKTFSSFKADEPFQQQIKQKASEFVRSYKENWFFIGGQNGCGKTHICTAISGQLLKLGESLSYMLWVEESTILKAKINEPEYKSLISVYQKVDVLYIDDLFKKTATSSDIRLAYQILDYRYRNSMCTIISSERLLNEIYIIDEAIGGRISETAIKINIPKNRKKDYRLKI